MSAKMPPLPKIPLPVKEENIVDLVKPLLSNPKSRTMIFNFIKQLLTAQGAQHFDADLRVLKVDGIEWVCLMFKEKSQ